MTQTTGTKIRVTLPGKEPRPVEALEGTEDTEQVVEANGYKYQL